MNSILNRLEYDTSGGAYSGSTRVVETFLELCCAWLSLRWLSARAPVLVIRATGQAHREYFGKMALPKSWSRCKHSRSAFISSLVSVLNEDLAILEKI